MTVSVLLLFIVVPWIDLQGVIVEFPDHAHLLFNSQSLVSFVTNIKTYSHKTNKLSNIYTKGRGARNISIRKWKINNVKIKIIPFINIFR